MGVHEQTFRSLAQVTIVRGIQEKRAEGEAIAAKAVVTECEVLVHRSRQACLEATLAWRHVTTGGVSFDPVLLDLWSRKVRGCKERHNAAQAKCADAEGRRHEALKRWHVAKLRLQQADEDLLLAKRRMVLCQEEKGMAALADRISFGWLKA